MSNGSANLTQAEDLRYAEMMAEFGAAIARLTHGYEADPDHRRDLQQEIHLALWRSLASFDQRCSLRTWVYRVAHNTALTYVTRRRRMRPRDLYTLEAIEEMAAAHDVEATTGRDQALEHVYRLIGLLRPLDRQLILLYLEDMDAESIAGITGLSSANVATRIHRIKTLLMRGFKIGGT